MIFHLGTFLLMLNESFFGVCGFVAIPSDLYDLEWIAGGPSKIAMDDLLDANCILC